MEARLDAYDAAVSGGEGPRPSVRYRLRNGDGDGMLRSSRQGLHSQIITHELLQQIITIERGTKKGISGPTPGPRLPVCVRPAQPLGKREPPPSSQKTAMRGVQRYRFRKLCGADRLSTYLPSLARTLLPSEAGRRPTLRCSVERIGPTLHSARRARDLSATERTCVSRVDYPGKSESAKAAVRSARPRSPVCIVSPLS